MVNLSDRFDQWSRAVTAASGSWPAFAAATLSVLVWVFAGFFVGFGDQLFELSINTATTIVTFLMVFVIQHTQTRDTAAMHLKLDELIRVTAARNTLIGLEQKTERDINRAKEEFPA